mgnify:CR=1 FL=1
MSSANGTLKSREIARPARVEAMGGAVSFSPESFHVIAGPCAVETPETTLACARSVARSGASLFRAGAYKPRTSPHTFQGLGAEGLEILAQVKREVGIGIVTEVMEPAAVALVAEVADVLQIGTRNMSNFPLLREVGRLRKPVLLKRGMAATLDELLHAADYILAGGNADVILCERGIRTFETYTRNTLDLSAVPALKELTGLPVIVDPSHGTGRRSLVAPMAKAALACGADGLLIETHPDPDNSWTSDGAQSLDLAAFDALMQELTRLMPHFGRAGFPQAARARAAGR